MKQGKGLVLVEVSDGVSVEDVRAATGSPFQVIIKLTASLVPIRL